MGRRLASLTLDNLDDLPTGCRGCVFWELDPVAGDRAAKVGDPGLEKEAWLSGVLLDWGSCGRVLYVDKVPAGYVLFAPPTHVPRSAAFSTSPVSADAVLLMTAQILPEFRGSGLGRVLVQTVVKDLIRRGGIRAIEAFGVTPAYAAHTTCVVPADYLAAVGFKTVRPHHRFPRLRLELRNVLTWREDVEVALERILGSMRPEPVRPAPVRRSGGPDYADAPTR
ncbi:MAG TPA: GNAT family N-acetyltransferase [Nocardioidaceae bacterium]|nr:GNAT family N-acetyltransferase [Nocardioidaceae bacterium]